MTGLRTALLGGIAALTFAGAAHATVISGGSVSLNNAQTDYSTLIGTLNKFDTSLGTLNSVSITYSYGFNSTITVNAQSASSGSIRTESAAQFSSNDAAVQSILNALVNTLGATTIGAFTLDPSAYDLRGTNRVFSLPAGNSATYTSDVPTSTQTVTTTTSSQITPFEAAGGGTFGVSGTTLTGTTSGNSGGNYTSSQQTFASQAFSINYDYTAAPPPVGVPEPASLALLGAGLLGLGLVRRRGA